MHAHVVVMTGAGVSADSGLRTFRDAGGLWEGYRPEDVATPEAWAQDRSKVWRFYQQRRAQMRGVEPNAAHTALARLQARCVPRAGVELTLVTQNVDDLHERAGGVPVHMHGEIAVLRCERCGRKVRDLEQVDVARFVACGGCGHDAMRPDVVWFGEVPLHLEVIEAAMATCTHFVAIGTSGAVWPAAGLLGAARQRGAATFVQALDPPDNLHPRDRFLQGRAAEVVPLLCTELAAELGV